MGTARLFDRPARLCRAAPTPPPYGVGANLLNIRTILNANTTVRA